MIRWYSCWWGGIWIYPDKFPTAAAPSTHFQPSKELSRGSTHNLDCWCKYQHEPKPTSSWFSDPSMMKNHQQWLESGVRTILPHYQDCLAGPSPVKWLCILRSHRLLPFVFFFQSRQWHWLLAAEISLEPTPVTPLVTKTFRFPLRRCLWSPESRVWTLTTKTHEPQYLENSTSDHRNEKRRTLL